MQLRRYLRLGLACAISYPFAARFQILYLPCGGDRQVLSLYPAFEHSNFLTIDSYPENYFISKHLNIFTHSNEITSIPGNIYTLLPINTHYYQYQKGRYIKVRVIDHSNNTPSSPQGGYLLIPRRGQGNSRSRSVVDRKGHRWGLLKPHKVRRHLVKNSSQALTLMLCYISLLLRNVVLVMKLLREVRVRGGS